MKRWLNILLLFVMLLPLASCHEEVEWKDDPYGNFDALWTILDEHYCFFAYKDIDWNGKVTIDSSIPGNYSRMSARDLFSMFAN